MKCITLISLVFASAIVSASEFRTFTSSDDRTISAKILKTNSALKKVTLLKENGKQVTVPISLFSEPDQAYITSWSPSPLSLKKESPKNDGALEKAKIESIAKEYAEACEDNDLETLKPLFHEWNDDSLSGGNIYFKYVKRVRVKKIRGNIVRIQVQTDRSKHDGYIQILSSGKIKYDPIINEHPISRAFFAYGQNMSELNSPLLTEERMRSQIKRFSPTGIPLFGLNETQARHEMLKSLGNIKEWLLDNGQTWDKTKPPMMCPPDLFKTLRAKYSF